MKTAIAILIAVVAGVSVTAAPTAAVSPSDAITAAVGRKLGTYGAIAVTALQTSVASEPGLEALAAPDARIGEPARFVLIVGRARRGLAVATVKVFAKYPRAARPIARDEEIGTDAVDFSEGELPAMTLHPLLSNEDIVGLKARRTIVQGETLTASVLWVPPLVKSGDEVTVTVRIGSVEVSNTGIASGSGQAGDVVRVLQKGSRRVLKGRITGRGSVEIVQ